MSKLVTETNNPHTAAIDTLSALEIVTLINQEDAKVAAAVQAALPQIAQAVDAISARLQHGGRLFYFGAGTSGRLAVLDASELPPTYNAPPELVQAFIAGGDRALRYSVEGAEDDAQAGRQLVLETQVQTGDAVIGITASGGAPWVLAAVEAARQCGAFTIGLVCNTETPLDNLVDLLIAVPVGPEVIAGSTRMKAGTAQKMVLNSISSAVMIRLGKVYGNRMVDLRASNQKLRGRALAIVQEICGVDAATAQRLLEETGYEVKPVLVMLLAGVDLEAAQRRLAAAGGVVRTALLQSA